MSEAASLGLENFSFMAGEVCLEATETKAADAIFPRNSLAGLCGSHTQVSFTGPVCQGRQQVPKEPDPSSGPDAY